MFLAAGCASALGAGGGGGEAGSSGAAKPNMERTLDHWLFGLGAAGGAFALARGGGAGFGAGGGEVLSLVASVVDAGGTSLAGIPIWSRSAFQ